jgi:hypothetical protein
MFLREVLPMDDREELFLRIVTASRSKFPENVYWISLAELHSDAFSLGSRLKSEDREVYYTPHPFASRGSATKDNAAGLISTVWMESDDETFVPTDVREAYPSIVVETSPGRHHAYWLLQGPVEKARVEETNRALCYRYLTRDRSGWDLSQLLRVPGFRNFKREVLTNIKVVIWDPERRYTMDVFGSLPTPVLSRAATPLFPEILPEVESVRREWFERLSSRSRRTLTDRASNRSNALWGLYQDCIRTNISKEEAFVLARTCPNNKFLDSLYNSDLELWKDLCGAYSQHEANLETGVVARLSAIRHQRGLHYEDKISKMADLVIDDLVSDGILGYDLDLQVPFYYRANEAIKMDRHTFDWQYLLDTRYNINAGAEDFGVMTAALRSRTRTHGIQATLRTFSYYDTIRNLLYVTNFSGGMWRLDGAVPKLVENGTDGVFIRVDRSGEPYTPVFESHGLLDEFVFSRPNYSRDYMDPEIAKLFVRAWTYSILIPELIRTRPLLIVEGTYGSGKSTMFRSILWLLRGRSADVFQMPHDSKELKEIAWDQNYLFFDGVDSLYLGLSNALSTISTGTYDRVRILYTHDFEIHRLHAFLGLSTMDAKFMREDVTDRSVLIQTDRLQKFLSETEFMRDVLGFRNELWGELLTDLNEVIRRLPQSPAMPEGVRLSDFSRLLKIVSEMKGKDAEASVGTLQRTQAESIIERSQLLYLLSFWLQDNRNDGKTLPCSKLHLQLLHLAQQLSRRDFEKEFSGWKSLLAGLRAGKTDFVGQIRIEIGKASLYPITIWRGANYVAPDPLDTGGEARALSPNEGVLRGPFPRTSEEGSESRHADEVQDSGERQSDYESEAGDEGGE